MGGILAGTFRVGREERGRTEIDAIVEGHKSISWYASLPLRAGAAKLKPSIKG
jgi:hypothetical protein